MHSIESTSDDPFESLAILTNRESRFRIYTLQSSHEIPPTPGCYAWFLPLWIYDEDLDRLTQIVADILRYEYTPKRTLSAAFTWRTVLLQVANKSRIGDSQHLRSMWTGLTSDPAARAELEQTLLEATLLMPPLYVGRTNNLSRRYHEHTDPTYTDRNEFRNRFSQHMHQLKQELSVSDLLFACIHTPRQLTKALNQFDPDKVEVLLEHLLIHFCQPPFSLK